MFTLSTEREQGATFPTTVGKGDMVRITRKTAAPEALTYEELLNDAVKLAELLKGSSQSPFVAFTQELGQVFVRIGGIATKKAKHGPEQRSRTVGEITPRPDS